MIQPLLLLVFETQNWDELLSVIHPKVSEDMNNSLCTPITRKEVKRALFDMGPLKSPGPDGLRLCFFRRIGTFFKMSTGGSGVCDWSAESKGGARYDSCSYSKEDQADRSLPIVRPISLCNVIYKIGSSKQTQNSFRRFGLYGAKCVCAGKTSHMSWLHSNVCM
jgi:hypothetical protein